MNDAALSHFVRIWRHYGPGVAFRVLYSKLTGVLDPANALSRVPLPRNRSPKLSVLLDASMHGSQAEALIDMVRGRDGADWELCICARIPMVPNNESFIAGIRGAPRIRIVAADASVCFQTAAQWTVEQATGEFVALLTPGAIPAVTAIQAVLSHMGDGADLVALVGTSDRDVRLTMQTKAKYLASGPGWLLTGDEQVAATQQADGVITYISDVVG